MERNPRYFFRSMESSFMPGKSNKKVFSEKSSMDLDVVEIPPPPVTRSKSKALKIKEVTNQEVIDVDMDEKHGKINIEGKADNKYKGKVTNQEVIDVDMDEKHGKINIEGKADNKYKGKVTNQEVIDVDMDEKHGKINIEGKADNKYKGKRAALGTPAASSSKRKKSVPPKHMHEDETLKNFEQFKKFDIVEDPSDHHYVKNGNSAKQPSKSWSKKIQEEWKILEKDLPDTIFVRAYESRMDLLRAVIIGAEGTPYHDGLFFFDVFFPDNYPNVPPQVYYYSRGLGLNPNLYNTGYVCLSLLNTWRGSQKERWIPKSSTMLQILVSIQGLILNSKPYFNEPGREGLRRTPRGEKSSQNYNESTFILSLKTMVFTLRKKPKNFEDFVLGHFFKRAREILVASKAYMDGAQVGCLVSCGVQDVDEGNKSCSKDFRSSLSGYIKEIVNAFTKIGVKDCTQIITPAKTDAKTGKRRT